MQEVGQRREQLPTNRIDREKGCSSPKVCRAGENACSKLIDCTLINYTNSHKGININSV